jgi:tetratricopeptide (TPR) repeat protein
MTRRNRARSEIARWLALALIAAWQLSASATTPVVPASDAEVLEVLPAVTRSRPAMAGKASPVVDASAAARLAREDIGVARQTGDTRYWGRAQAALAPWWGRADAPVELAVLQATVQQGRHEFAAARTTLLAALARDPSHAQGWLTLASLDRLTANYASSLASCAAVARAGQPLYAQACRLETESLLGRHAVARSGLEALLRQAPDAAQRSWLGSLLAEAHERAGADALAAAAYRQSLRDGPDLYTAIAFADLLLRTGQNAQALQVLEGVAETDAVLLRRGAAWRRMGDARWTAVRDTLRERTAELLRRGDDPNLHARELALAALWLDDVPAQAPAGMPATPTPTPTAGAGVGAGAERALVLARRNLELQREPVDWWVALESARQARDVPAAAALADALRQSGLQDQRLVRLMADRRGS